MIFFFKKKPLVLYYGTRNKAILELASVQKSSKFIPDWWKSIPTPYREEGDYYDTGTMRHCLGFKNFYRYGITIPMWCDLALNIGERGTGFYQYQFSDRRSIIDVHSSGQSNNAFNPSEFQHLKIISPWIFHCLEDINFMFLEHTWSTINFSTLRVLPGIVDYKYTHSTNINLMIKRTSKLQEILIPFLQPLVNIIPMTERPIKLELIDVDEKLFRDQELTTGFSAKFSKKYSTIRKILESKEK